MKVISKVPFKKSGKVNKTLSGKSNSVSTSVSVKHQFRVISADEVNKNRSNAYKYLAF